MRITHYIAGAILAGFFVFMLLIMLYGIGALFAFVLNTFIEALRNTPQLGAWQGMACLVLGAVIVYFTKRK